MNLPLRSDRQNSQPCHWVHDDSERLILGDEQDEHEHQVMDKPSQESSSSAPSCLINTTTDDDQKKDKEHSKTNTQSNHHDSIYDELDLTELDLTESEHPDDDRLFYRSSTTIHKPQEPLLPLSELIQRLVQVNQKEEPVQQERKPTELKQEDHHQWTLEDMTSLLAQLNRAENKRSVVRSKDRSHPHQQQPDDEKDEVVSLSLFELEEFHEKQIGTDEDVSLYPESESCASSITWYEGSQCEEVEVTDNWNQEEDLFADALSVSSSFATEDDEDDLPSATSQVFVWDGTPVVPS